MNFVSIDYFLLRQEHEQALKAIDALPKAIAEDPYMELARANSLISANRYREALDAADRAIAKEPDLLGAYWIAVAVSVKQREFGETLKWLKTIDREFEVSWDEILARPVYQDFRNSPEYCDWLNYIGK